MNNKTNYILIGLLVLGAFLVGSLWTRVRYLEQGKQEVKETKTPQVTVGAAQPTRPPFNPSKTEKPTVKFFVMSFCPYGNQAEAGLQPVYDLLKDKVNWQPQYIIYKDYCNQAPEDQKADCEKNSCLKKDSQTYCSMHGLGELNQDVREICAFNMGQSAKWWDFVSRVNDKCSAKDVDTCWEAQAKEAGLDTLTIKSCQESQAFSLMDKEIAQMEKYQAQGSPMVFVNDQLYDGGRAPEDYKKGICGAFNKEPTECAKALGAASANTAGGCGQ